MSNRLVICSSPNDDDYSGIKHNADFTNICENDWDSIAQRAKSYQHVILEHNSDDVQLLYRLSTFANTYGFVAPNLPSTFYTNKITDLPIGNKILFIGCSHTNGDGHASVETNYTSQLCKHMQLTPLIDSHPGKGNALTEEKLHCYNLTNQRVIIQYTDIYRINYNGINTNGYDYDQSQHNVFTDQVLASEFIHLVKRISNYLRSCNTRFAFFLISHDYPILQEIISHLSEYPEFINMQDTMVDVGDLGHHFGKDTHSLWTQKIIDSGLLS